MVAPIGKPSITFRDRMRDLWSPPWLATGNNEKLGYVYGLLADVLGDALLAAYKMRWPGFDGYLAIGKVGRERRITRGQTEPDAAYATRLRRWLDDHRLRGGPYAMLAQLFAYFAPGNFPIDLVYPNGAHYHMATDGTVTRTVDFAFGFDIEPQKWARWWLIYSTDSIDIPTLKPEDIAALGVVPREWNAAHTIGTVIVTSTNAELWNWPQGHTWNESGTWNTSGHTLEIAID